MVRVQAMDVSSPVLGPGAGPSSLTEVDFHAQMAAECADESDADDDMGYLGEVATEEPLVGAQIFDAEEI